MRADPARRHAAVLGHPVDHSLSPVLHRAAYAELGLAWDYERIDVTIEQLPRFVRSRDSSWAGLSLTMPLKQAVLPLLDEVDPLAAATGAANTVVFRDGRRLGFNTDVDGLVSALDEQQAGHGPAVVLGAGATARSAVAALARRGSTGVTAYVRRPEAADDLRATAAAVGTDLAVLGWDGAAEGLDADVVVATVPRGAADGLAASLPRSVATLLDVVYDPWPTPLAAAWAGRGGAVASGLDLLLHQAIGQIRLMTGFDAPVAVLRAALLAAAHSR